MISRDLSFGSDFFQMISIFSFLLRGSALSFARASRKEEFRFNYIWVLARLIFKSPITLEFEFFFYLTLHATLNCSRSLQRCVQLVLKKKLSKRDLRFYNESELFALNISGKEKQMKHQLHIGADCCRYLPW